MNVQRAAGIELDEFLQHSFTALQNYVNEPDANYAWTRISRFDEQELGCMVLWLNMTSQAWLTPEDTVPDPRN